LQFSTILTSGFCLAGVLILCLMLSQASVMHAFSPKFFKTVILLPSTSFSFLRIYLLEDFVFARLLTESLSLSFASSLNYRTWFLLRVVFTKMSSFWCGFFASSEAEVYTLMSRFGSFAPFIIRFVKVMKLISVFPLPL